MPLPGHLPFLRAICEQPADDAPRLIYADWLEEHGDPDRAEFIRLQVALDHRPDEADALRATALLTRHHQTWLAETREPLGVEWDKRFHRGFLRGATFHRPRLFIQKAGRATAVAPITAVTIRRVEDVVLERVLEVPAVSQLESITLAEFCAFQSRRLWTVIAGASRLANLRSLVIVLDRPSRMNGRSRDEFDAEWQWAITESPHLQRLEVFAPGTGEVFRDLRAVRRPAAATRAPDPELTVRVRTGPWQALRRTLGIGG